MTLNVERVIIKQYELTKEEIATLEQANKIINAIANKMENINDEQDFEVLLQNKSTGDIFSAYDINTATETIQAILDSEVKLDEY